MKNGRNIKIIAAVIGACLVGLLTFNFMKEISLVFAKAAVVSAARLLPSAAIEAETENNSARDTGPNETTEAKQKSETDPVTASASAVSDDFYTVPDDIQKLIEKANQASVKDKKDGTIFEKQYKNEGVTDSFSNIKLKNLNKTKVSVEQLFKEKADLSVSRTKPSVLIYHTHTTESYQILDRDFYAQGYTTRSKDSSFNMVRVGDEIVIELEQNGFQCIHDTEIHD
ncbi:MAG: stage II sporulation protein P, partial [Acutalibacteraceae bacterium]